MDFSLPNSSGNSFLRIGERPCETQSGLVIASFHPSIPSTYPSHPTRPIHSTLLSDLEVVRLEVWIATSARWRGLRLRQRGKVITITNTTTTARPAAIGNVHSSPPSPFSWPLAEKMTPQTRRLSPVRASAARAPENDLPTPTSTFPTQRSPYNHHHHRRRPFGPANVGKRLSGYRNIPVTIPTLSAYHAKFPLLSSLSLMSRGRNRKYPRNTYQNFKTAEPTCVARS
ncbi:hypothetical protein DFJ73DRAFT_6981 [Zopfochytrium polystomum]|nr:hypothetical protein DFJ73DRAFT_6981 [Zopfochytrium polystomum]